METDPSEFIKQKNLSRPYKTPAKNIILLSESSENSVEMGFEEKKQSKRVIILSQLSPASSLKDKDYDDVSMAGLSGMPVAPSAAKIRHIFAYSPSSNGKRKKGGFHLFLSATKSKRSSNMEGFSSPGNSISSDSMCSLPLGSPSF